MRLTFDNDFKEKLIITDEGILFSNKKGITIIPRTQISEALKCSLGILLIKCDKKLVQFTYRSKDKEKLASAIEMLNSLRGEGLTRELTVEDFGIVKESVETDLGKAIIAVVKPAITNQLKAPASAQFQEDLISIVCYGENVYEVSGYVDSQNGYGAMIRNDFSATVVMTNGVPDVKSASVGTQKAKNDAKEFGTNYVKTLILTGIGAAILYFIINAVVNGSLPDWILFFI